MGVKKLSFTYRFFKLKRFLIHNFYICYHRLFNHTVRQQVKDYKQIPIIIISFNQLYYLKQLVAFLLDKKYKKIVILDNHSTYQPLLDYFETLPNSIIIHQLSSNEGHLSFWKQAKLFKSYGKGYYAVTDADIVPVDTCPEDFLQTFRILLDKAYDRTKVGFSLKLDDIPDTNPNKERILNWESQFWTSRIHLKAYKAEIDTTFALYKPGYKYKLKHFTKAWRTDYPLQAKHGGWYLDVEHLTHEQRYYMSTANESASWQINEDGKLINKTHKPLYHNK